MNEVIGMFQFLRMVIIDQKLVLWLIEKRDYVPFKNCSDNHDGSVPMLEVIQFLDKPTDMNKKIILMNKKRGGYVYLKSHIFSYIDDYVLN
jgi:hypothetical protein